MDTSTLDFNTLTLLVAILGSSFTVLGMMLRQINRLDTKIDTKIDALDTKIDTKIDALDTKISALDTKVDTKIGALDTKMSRRFDAMGRGLSDIRERVARIEGYLIGPGRFTTRPSRPPAAVDPPLEDPDPGGRRQAG